MARRTIGGNTASRAQYSANSFSAAYGAFASFKCERVMLVHFRLPNGILIEVASGGSFDRRDHLGIVEFREWIKGLLLWPDFQVRPVTALWRVRGIIR